MSITDMNWNVHSINFTRSTIRTYRCCGNVAATGDGSNFVRISYWVSWYWRQSIRAPTWSVCYSLVVICSVSFRSVCCFVCPLERLSRALVSEQDGRAFCVRSASNLIIALFLLITRIFGYICQYIRLLTCMATYFVIFFRGFWYFWT